MKIGYISILCYSVSHVSAFWDMATTTPYPSWRWDENIARTSRFRWQRSEKDFFRLFYPWWDWWELEFRRRLYVIAGISYKMINLSTAAILNRRTLVTAANYLDVYMDEARMIRVWALGRVGEHNTPFRYRAWRITRLLPRSMNPEHQHGAFAFHSPRHDVAIIHTQDQMYVFTSPPKRYAYAYRAFLGWPTSKLTTLTWFAGCGFEYHAHVHDNYKIFYALVERKYLRDCSMQLPKWWGKFICYVNYNNFPCIQNGGPLLDYDLLVGIGCFEIRNNEDRQIIFTDLRFYTYHIQTHAYITPGEYYEYAYPQWSVKSNWLYDGHGNNPTIPTMMVRDDLYPLGRK